MHASLRSRKPSTGSDPPPDLDVLERSISDALLLDAVDARLYSLLAEIHYRRGDTEAAFRGFARALALSKTEVHALQRTIVRSMEQHDLADAVSNVDILLRRWPGKLEAIASIFPALLADERGYSEILDMLASDTPWRGGLFRVLSADPATLALAGRLLQDLNQSEHPPHVNELAMATGALIRDKRYNAAYRLFLMTLSKDEKLLGGYIHNGGFAGRATGRPFDWQLREQPGHTISFTPEVSGGGSRPGLLIRFNGTPVKNIAIQQYLQLPPGATS